MNIVSLVFTLVPVPPAHQFHLTFSRNALLVVDGYRVSVSCNDSVDVSCALGLSGSADLKDLFSLSVVFGGLIHNMLTHFRKDMLLVDLM